MVSVLEGRVTDDLCSLCYVSSRCSLFATVTSLNKPRSASMPPASIPSSSSHIRGGSPTPLSSNAAVDGCARQVDGGSAIVSMNSLGDSGRHKRPVQYSLFRGGGRDEDCDLPTKRLKTLQTTWNYTPGPSSEATNYLNQRMLELSRITRRAVAARMRYQRLRSHELDLIKSILEDETEVSQAQLKGIDLQIGSIRNVIQDAGMLVIENKGRRFDPSESGPWCERVAPKNTGVIIPQIERPFGRSMTVGWIHIPCDLNNWTRAVVRAGRISALPVVGTV
ncbi:hypothetical protein EDB19DRAFT_1762909 [Suillus lakei]|nr:hypothetical protein EDB19DRAFT_1762909 [Suillus lakei]